MGDSYLDIKSNKKIAILDVNNFYVSCERLFQPEFGNVPAVVLSNNDGCVIARSQEVKDMGVKMGQPLFQVDVAQKDKIKKFSSNYALYGDISDRIVTILKREIPNIEIYSIDEAFLDLSHVDVDDLVSEMSRLKSKILKLVGVPVSIGVGPNKTLAKLCNYLAKGDPKYSGVCSYWDVEDLVDSIDIGEVWGVGRKFEKKLKDIGVETVGDFKKLGQFRVRKMMHTPGVKTYLEILGVLCNPLLTKFKKPKIISTSRSFGQTVWDPHQIKNAIWTFTQNCHRKLSREGLDTTKISIFLTTNRFDDNYFVWTTEFKLNRQSHDLQTIWNQISPHLEGIPVRLYSRCGVTFFDLRPSSQKQEVIFLDNFPHCQIPHVNHQMWDTRREFLSPQYTTKWSDIPQVF